MSNKSQEDQTVTNMPNENGKDQFEAIESNDDLVVNEEVKTSSPIERTNLHNP